MAIFMLSQKRLPMRYDLRVSQSLTAALAEALARHEKIAEKDVELRPTEHSPVVNGARIGAAGM
jgi:hypothetical protein